LKSAEDSLTRNERLEQIADEIIDLMFAEVEKYAPFITRKSMEEKYLSISHIVRVLKAKIVEKLSREIP